MKRRIPNLGAILFLFSTLDPQLSTCHAQGTAFTYQGRLNDGANPATGIYDLRLTIYDALSGGAFVAGPLTNAAVGVTNGLFTVTLDFGAGVFTGANRWLEIAVRTNGGGAFAALAPRQALSSTPYAIRAATAASASSVAAANITGTIPSTSLPANVLTNNASGVSLNGTFTGNGAGVTNINLSANSGGVITLSGNFRTDSSPGVGMNPNCVVAADVNGDGTMDLISANESANGLTVLTNNGSGGFPISSSPAVGVFPKAVAAADVNGDGKVDLITANWGDATLSVLTNNGIGFFALAASPVVGTYPTAVAAADVNGDGKVDLISANEGANTLTVLTNNGRDDFSTASSPAVGMRPLSVAAADVSGDGKVDLISANANANTLTVLTNNGSGGYAIASSPAVGAIPGSVVAADVNGDGKVDLICANYFDSTLTVLVNNGSGGFTVASSPGVGVNPVAVAAADVNGDNKVDLITASFGSITILTNNGSGGFATVTNMWAGSTPVSVVAADLNGDGRADLAVANRIAYRVTVLLNEPRFQGSVAGDGSGLTGLNASQLASGTVADTRLSANVALLDTEQTFTAAKSWGVGSQLSTDGNGAIELGPPSGSGQQPFIDFHYGTGSAQDFNVRMINDGNGQLSIYAPALLTRFSTTSMAINTAASISGNNTLEFGAGFASKEPNAGKIGYQTWSPDALDIVGAGTTSTSRKVKFYAEGGTTFNGSVAVPNLVAVSANPYTSPQLAISQLNTADHARLQIGVSTFPQWTLAVSPGASPQLLFWNGTANVAWLNYDGTFNAAGDVYARGVKLTSDRNAKENFQPVNPQTVLDKVAALPISQWNFKTAPGETHIGPMAQDFYAAFSTGSDEKHIATVDADGVALAAIQGLNQKLTEELKRRDAENAELKRRLEVLERILRAQKPN